MAEFTVMIEPIVDDLDLEDDTELFDMVLLIDTRFLFLVLMPLTGPSSSFQGNT